MERSRPARKGNVPTLSPDRTGCEPSPVRDAQLPLGLAELDSTKLQLDRVWAQIQRELETHAQRTDELDERMVCGADEALSLMHLALSEP